MKMNKKKFKKLFNNPKQFFLDSNLVKNNVLLKKIDLNTKFNNSLGVILFDGDPSQLKETINSIKINKAYKSNVKITVVNADEHNGDIVALIRMKATELNCDYIKIMYPGEILKSGFVDVFSKETDLSEAHEIIAHNYAHDLENKADVFLTHSKVRESKTGKPEKEFIFPDMGCVIIRSDIVIGLKDYIYGNDVKSNVLNLIHILNEKGNNLKVLWNDRLISSANNGLRIENKLQDFLKKSEEVIFVLEGMKQILLSEVVSTKVKKTIFSFLHGMVVILLRNKKADETLDSGSKEKIIDLITMIISLIGVDVLKKYSSTNYNHIHKIGYLNILGEEALGSLCYIEDVDIEDRLIKLKVAAGIDMIPSVLLNNFEATPVSLKIKPLTIFDKAFAYEIFLWVKFKNHQHNMQLTAESNVDMIINGKRFKSCKVQQAIQSFNKKKAVLPVLPVKAKVLRYLATRKLINKRFKNAWVFVDNELRADDNAEHFYKYVSSHHKSENSFFLLNNKSSDWKRLKDEGVNLIKFGGFWHRIALINAGYLLSSHANPAIVNFLPKKHFSDIMKYKFIFLQHGITKDDQSEWLNSRKIDILVTAGAGEYEDIADRGRYRFTSKEVVLTGFPRYDNLFSSDVKKRKILIMPTWRKSLSGELIKKSSKRIKNENFSVSAFASMWGGFLRCEELEKLVTQFDYEVEFFPHPNLADYIEDLKIPQYIKVKDITSSRIQNVFKESDILITDYSSVAFDIAYMKKPVIYFQFDIETFFSEHSYSKGYFDYQKHGFGPVCNDIEDVIHNLSAYVKNDCRIPAFYGERINAFFPFQDRENSARLYQRIIDANCQKPDELSVISKAESLVKYQEIQAACSLLGSCHEVLHSLSPSWNNRLYRVWGTSYFWCALFDFEGSKEQLIVACKEYANRELHNAFRSNVDALLSYANEFLFKPESISNINTDVYPDSSAGMLKQFEFLSKNQRDLIRFTLDTTKAFSDGNFSEVLNIFDSANEKNDILKSKLLCLIMVISLIKTGKIDEAVAILQNLTFELSLNDKEKILFILNDVVSDAYYYRLPIQCLYPESSENKSAIESFFRFCDVVNKQHFVGLPITELSSACSLSRYLDLIYHHSNFSEFLEILNKSNYKHDYIVLSDRAERYLIAVIKVEGVERFVQEFRALFSPVDISAELTQLILNSVIIGFDNAFIIVKNIISCKNIFMQSIDVYKLALHFHKNGYPLLAKEISSQYVMRKHEEYYSSPENWQGSDDYRTLMLAISELNSVGTELNKLSILPL